jgi:RNA polymerase sigma-70 factor (ECF subfamily)
VATLRDSFIARVPFAESRASDDEWAEARAIDEQRATLAALYAEHAQAIHRFLSGVLGDVALAADATQETFVRAFRRFDTLCDRERTVPWLFGIARNVSLEARKARRNRERVIATEHDDREGEDRAARSPETELLDREALGVVNAALARLSEDRRAVLLLRLDHGLSYDEIAELMDWSLAKAKVEIFRAREVLRETLAEYREGEAR